MSDSSSNWWGGARDGDNSQPDKSARTPNKGNGEGGTLKPLTEVRTAGMPRNATNNLSLLGFYLGGISGGFTPSDIPEMKRDPDVSLGLEYLLTPILNAIVKVVGNGPEISEAQETFDRFWQHDLESFSDMFCYGYCPAEVKYKKAEPSSVGPIGTGPNAGANAANGGAGGGASSVPPPPTDTSAGASGLNMGLNDDDGEGEGGGGDDGKANKPQPSEKADSGQGGTLAGKPLKAKLEYDGMIPLEPDTCVPYVDQGELAYIKVNEKIKLEANTDSRPAKGFWLANDPTYSPYIGNSVLPRCWVFWRAKIGMPDSAVEVLLKANYKAAFSGLEVRYPSEIMVDDDGVQYDPRAEAEWYAENIKAGTNIVLPSETDEKGKPKWEIKPYSGPPVDIERMLPMMDWLSKQIHRGMGVVDEVIAHDSDSGGGYSRANISRQMFLMLALRRARRIAHAFDQAICKPLVKRNGGKGDYKVVVTIPGMEDEPPPGMQGNGGPGGLGGPPMPGGGAQDGMAPGEGGTQEHGPLASLFHETFNGGGGGESEGSGTNMSLSTFLGQFRMPTSVPPPAGE